MVKKHRVARLKYLEHLMKEEVKRDAFLEKSRAKMGKRAREEESDEANVNVDIVPAVTITTDEKTGETTTKTVSAVVETAKVVEEGADKDGRQLKRTRPERKL